MAGKNALIRYIIIDRMLKRKMYPNKERLLEEFERNDIFIKERQLDYDIKDMRTDERLGYKAPINFNHEMGGYEYTIDDYTISSLPLTNEQENAVEFMLEYFRDLKVFEPFADEINGMLAMLRIKDDTRKYIQTDRPTAYKGSKWLPTLVEAIKMTRKIRFTYISRNAEAPKESVLHPYLVKEHRHRWYLIALHEGIGSTLTFELTRIQGVEILNEEYPYKEAVDFDPEDHFKFVYGITKPPVEEPTDIVLSFNPAIADYIKTLPIHHTTDVIEDNDKEYRIKLRLYLYQGEEEKSWEIIRIATHWADDVTVLEPKSLADDVLKKLQAAVANYKK